ncbi:MAG: hypothetical protein ACK4NX_02005 [Candidatus Paceibacteria bacterium]
MEVKNLMPWSQNSPFLSYGTILFSLMGYIAIPEIALLLGKEKAKTDMLGPIIIFGTAFSAILSGLFMIAILGISGQKTSQDAISGLVGIFPGWLVFLAFLLAFLEIATSYLIFGVSIRETLKVDFKFPEIAGDIIVALFPLSLFLAGFSNFVWLISFLGAIWVSMDAILIMLIWKQAKQRLAKQDAFLKIPDWILNPMIFLVGLGGLIAVFFGI